MNPPKYIGLPFRSGCNREGAQLAPGILCEMMGLEKSDWHFLHFASETQPLTDEQQQQVKNYDSVLEMSRLLRDTVALDMQPARPLVVIGGDHSLALGSIAGILRHTPDVGVIWFDAHGDINTEASSPSANAHGMPVAALMGLCHSELNNIADVRLKPHNIFWVGARDLDEGEVSIIESLGITDHVYSSDFVRKHGMTSVMEDIRQKMIRLNISSLHLSFDIDGMDPSVVQATGTRVPEGLLQRDLDDFIAALPSLSQLRSMDFVEYNPLMDDAAQTTAHWCVRTLQQLVKVCTESTM